MTSFDYKGGHLSHTVSFHILFCLLSRLHWNFLLFTIMPHNCLGCQSVPVTLFFFFFAFKLGIMPCRHLLFSDFFIFSFYSQFSYTTIWLKFILTNTLPHETFVKHKELPSTSVMPKFGKSSKSTFHMVIWCKFSAHNLSNS